MKRTAVSKLVTIGAVIVAIISLAIVPASAVSEPQITGDPASISQGFGKPFAVNETQMKERLTEALTKLGDGGVDVSEPQANLANGDVAAAMKWLMEYHKEHGTPDLNRTGIQGMGPRFQNVTFPDLNRTGIQEWGPRFQNVTSPPNATQLQEQLKESLVKLGETGVDVSEPQADLANGDTHAAIQWIMAYNKDHTEYGNPAMNMTGKREWNQSRNSGNFSAFRMDGSGTAATKMKDRIQDDLTKLGNTGVDVSEPQSDLANGDIAAAMKWLATYHQEHPEQALNMTTDIQ